MQKNAFSKIGPMVQRVTYLDGLKGLGCLMVFICHFIMVGFAYPVEWYHNIVSSTLFNGNIFVCVFLIASAFGMTGSVKRNIKKENGLRNLILKRYLRLAVPIVMILLIIGSVHVLKLQFNSAASLLNGNVRLGQELGTWVTIKDFPKALLLTPFGESYNWMSQAWMMGYIYFGTFLILILDLGLSSLNRIKRIPICVFFMIIFYFIDAYYINILFGYLLYDYMAMKKHEGKDILNRIAPALSFVILCIFVYYLRQNDIRVLDIYSTVIAIILMITLVHTSFLKKLFSSKPFVWLGKISFSLYLLHMMVIVTFSSFVYVYTDDFNKTLQSIITLISSIVFLVLLSALSKHFIEDKISAKVTTHVMDFMLK